MQELMSRHKAYALNPRDCLKTTLFQKWQKMVAPPGKINFHFVYMVNSLKVNNQPPFYILLHASFGIHCLFKNNLFIISVLTSTQQENKDIEINSTQIKLPQSLSLKLQTQYNFAFMGFLVSFTMLNL